MWNKVTVDFAEVAKKLVEKGVTNTPFSRDFHPTTNWNEALVEVLEEMYGLEYGIGVQQNYFRSTDLLKKIGTFTLRGKTFSVDVEENDRVNDSVCFRNKGYIIYFSPYWDGNRVFIKIHDDDDYWDRLFSKEYELIDTSSYSDEEFEIYIREKLTNAFDDIPNDIFDLL